MFKAITYETKGNAAYITMNRPEALNGMDFDLLGELNDALDLCGSDETIRVVVITGSGKAFSAGGDVQWMKDNYQEDHWEREFFRLVGLLHQAILKIRNIEKPVIAKVNGVASGAGFNLALACDVRIASEQVRFNQAYINIGLVPDGGGSYFLTQLLGPARATELLFTGRVVDAKEAFDLGLLNKMVPHESLDEETEKMVNIYGSGPTVGYGKIKQLINQAMGDHLRTQLEWEQKGIVSAGLTEDFKEGLQGFFQKRKPVYKGC